MSRGMSEAVFTTIMVLVLFAMFLAGIGAPLSGEQSRSGPGSRSLM